MAQRETPKWIGVISLVVGVLLALMLFFELKDGVLLGRKSNGLTVSSNPITYYISVTLQSLIVLLLLWAGFTIVRRNRDEH